MKKILKAGLWVIGAIVLIIAVAALFIQMRGIPSYDVHPVDLHVDATPELLAQGSKIAFMNCRDCHYNDETGLMTGKQLKEIPPEFGVNYSANITHDKTYGAGRYTDGEIAYLLRTGIKRDGKQVIIMPQFPNLSDEDVAALITWLRSDDPSLKATTQPSTPCKPSFFGKVLYNTLLTPLPYPDKPIPHPDITDKVAYGKYLVTAQMDCYSCHSKDFKSNNSIDPEKSEGYLGGGIKLVSEDGKPIHSANITMDKETGIGNYSVEEFKTILKFGKRPDGSNIRWPMKPFVFLTDDELEAIYAYLQTVPPIKNKVQRSS